MPGRIKSEQIRDDTIRSEDIKDYTIVDADIAPSANISESKLDIRWRSPVQNYSDLPLTGNSDGDIRIVKNRLELYQWDAALNEWKQLTFSGNISNTIREDHIATQNQTVFNLSNSYKPGTNNLRVYVNGLLQKPGASDDYVETNDTTVTFNYALDDGNLVTFLIGNATNNYFGEVEQFIALAGQTVFNTSFKFKPGNNEIDVFKNGLLMVNGSSDDYTETGEQQITFNYSLSAGDVVVIRKARDYTKTGGSINKLDDLDNLQTSIIPTDATGYTVNLGSQTNPFNTIYCDTLIAAQKADIKLLYDCAAITSDISTTSTTYVQETSLNVSINAEQNDIIKATLQGWFWNSTSGNKVTAYIYETTGNCNTLFDSYISTNANAAGDYQGTAIKMFTVSNTATLNFTMYWRATGGGTANGRYVSLIIEKIGKA